MLKSIFQIIFCPLKNCFVLILWMDRTSSVGWKEFCFNFFTYITDVMKTMQRDSQIVTNLQHRLFYHF